MLNNDVVSQSVFISWLEIFVCFHSQTSSLQVMAASSSNLISIFHFNNPMGKELHFPNNSNKALKPISLF